MSSIVYGRIECSKLKPMEVPSEPCGIELHVVDVHLDLGVAAEHVLRRVSSDVSVTAPQSPTFMRMANGSFLSCPLSMRRLVLGKREQHSLRVALAAVSRRQSSDRHDVELLHGRVRRTQAVGSRQPGLAESGSAG